MASNLRVVLDTNILISALIHAGEARDFVYNLLYRKIRLVTSNYIINETEEVLKRNKFKDKEVLSELWNLIREDFELVKVRSKTSNTILRDPKDHPILQTAFKGKAKFIITGDEDLLSIESWKGVKIVKMSEFRKLLT